MDRPIYVVSGFLDSGKTTAIKRTLLDPRFTEKETTLIISFEEGDEEYDKDFLNKTHSNVVYMDFKDFDGNKLLELDDIYNPDRFFIEFNGMDDDSILMNMDLPLGMEYAQLICTIDASKFKLQVSNMPQFMFNHVNACEIIVLNRYEGADFRYLRNNIKSMNQYCAIGLEDKDGNMYEMPKDDLFDKNNLDINDTDYGLFYMDAIDNYQKYNGAPIKFNGFYLEGDKETKVIGRFAMVCCANDTQRLGMMVKGLKQDLEVNHYYHIEGIFRVKNERGGIRIYIEGKNATEIEKPKEEFVNFN